MNVLKEFNNAMSYIEKNLMNEIVISEISTIAGCSEYHFRRMFSFMAGMPLGEYTRRRRLSIAGIMLQSGNQKILDLALQLGYETPESFSKAFQAMHGIIPSQAKKGNVDLKIFPPMRFQLTVQGGEEMNYRIVEKSEFQIIGFKKRITMQFKGVNPQMNSLLQEFTPEIIAELKRLCNLEPMGMLNVSANFSDRTQEGAELDQYIGVATTKTVTEKYESLTVDKSTWAVFRCEGTFPDALQKTWAQIYAEWFPGSGYELTEGPEILWNESPDTTKPDYKSEIWIPIRKLSVKI